MRRGNPGSGSTDPIVLLVADVEAARARVNRSTGGGGIAIRNLIAAQDRLFASCPATVPGLLAFVQHARRAEYDLADVLNVVERGLLEMGQ